MEVDLHFKTIESIREKTTNIGVAVSSCSIQEIVAKYSNTKKPLAKMVINKKPISRNNSYLVTFTCPTCHTSREITLNLFMRRITNNTMRCYCCHNRDEEKCEKQSEFMKDNMTKILEGDYVKSQKISEKTLAEHLEYSRDEWKKEDVEFTNHYTFSHLSEEEFTNILPKIKGVGNNKIVSLEGWSYFPYYRVFNQTRYTPMLINTTTNLVEKPQYISFECENCGNCFTHRDLEIVKNKLKIYCQGCTLTNRTFRLRTHITKNGSKILWQSIPERRFIEWCDEHSIEIKNGPTIQYKFQDKIHGYRVDFELPSLKRLVEIKDNHCWHKQQLASGKFGAKETAANKWCIDKGYTFTVVFPKTLQEYKDSLIKSCKI
jgi:very-short-patch-repair endonuclease